MFERLIVILCIGRWAWSEEENNFFLRLVEGRYNAVIFYVLELELEFDFSRGAERRYREESDIIVSKCIWCYTYKQLSLLVRPWDFSFGYWRYKVFLPSSFVIGSNNFFFFSSQGLLRKIYIYEELEVYLPEFESFWFRLLCVVLVSWHLLNVFNVFGMFYW